MNKIKNLNFLCMLALSLVFSSCKKNIVEISNGYNLVKDYEGKVFINHGSTNAFEFPISGFVVNNKCIYGWADNSKENLFFLNTTNNKKIVFDTWNELNAHMIGMGLPALTMKESYTFLDVTTGHKKKTW